tara:strand:- start:1520 stop:2350 length:831 start_codon:yes stop_codon:yes gene_type:complete
MKKKLLTNIISRLGALGNLKEPESVGALVPLKKQEVVPSRREFVKKAASAVAQTALPRGALTTLIEKGLEPVAKGKVPISTFNNILTNSIDFKKAVLELESKRDDIDSGFTPMFKGGFMRGVPVRYDSKENTFPAEILDENKQIPPVDALNDDEVNKLFEYAYSRPLRSNFMGDVEDLVIKPEFLAIEGYFQEKFYDILDAAGVSIKDFVTERLKGKDVSPKPEALKHRGVTTSENNLLNSFIDRLNKSGYSGSEITEFLEDSMPQYQSHQLERYE